MSKQLPRLNVIKLAPVQVERIWGGTWLREQFGFKTKSENIGETWVISAHPSGNCRILNHLYYGMTLSELYAKRRDLFAFDKNEKFPLLVKLIDAKDDLSVQVHPGNEYAQKHEKQSGKSEAWVILNTKPGTRILVGHSAKTREQLRDLIYQGEWNKLLSYRPLEIGEIVNIPSGTLHAICAGTSLIEIQQSSDVTYRVYDYDRVDGNGHKRELHLDKSIDVIDVPHVSPPIRKIPISQKKNYLQELLLTPHFTINSLIVDKCFSFYNEAEKYYLVTVIDGTGKIGAFNAKKGDSFIITSLVKKLKIQGCLNLIIANT
jgi:mannose-6-phosphate isomerase